jgi:hypothetical protein
LKSKTGKKDGMQKQITATAQLLDFDKAQFIICFTTKRIISWKKVSSCFLEHNI